MLASNLHIFQFIVLTLLGILSFNVSHLVNGFGRGDSHIPKWVAFLLSVFSTVFIILIGFYINTNFSTNLIDPDLIVLTGIGYIYALITLQVVLANASYAFKWLGFLLVTMLCITMAVFYIFFTPANLLLKVMVTISFTILPYSFFEMLKNKKRSTYLYGSLYVILYIVLSFSWNTISFDNFLPISPIKLSPQPTVYNSSNNFVLRSEIGIDYSKLKELLSKEKFRAADVETRNIVSRSLQNIDNYELYKETFSNASEHLELTPCQDLLTIDRLWSFYSDAKFSLSIQSNILSQIRWGWQTKYNLLTDLVGWRINKEWISYENLTFNNKAPLGHLPYSFTRGRPIEEFRKKISKCENI